MSKAFKKKIKNDLIYVFVSFIVFLFRRLPRRGGLFVGKFLGGAAYLILRAERNKVLQNVNYIFGNQKSAREIKTFTFQVFTDLGKNAADALKLSGFSKEKIERIISRRGFEHLENCLRQQRGVICITGHIGIFEFCHKYVALQGYPVTVVGTRLYDERLDRIIVNNRAGDKIRYFHRDGYVPALLRALKNKEILGMLIDQDTHVRGVFSQFMGKPAFTPSGAVELALRTGALIVPLALQRDIKDRLIYTVLTPLELQRSDDSQKDLQVNVQRCNDALEKLILQYPTQWVWMHERWKTQSGSQQ